MRWRTVVRITSRAVQSGRGYDVDVDFGQLAAGVADFAGRMAGLEGEVAARLRQLRDAEEPTVGPTETK